MAAGAALSRRVERFARRSATAVRLEDLYKWGQGDASTRLRMARFLHHEIKVRNAQLCKELRLLPFGLAETQGVSDVVSCFSSYVDLLDDSPVPECDEGERRFTELLGSILKDPVNVVTALGQGVLEVRESLGEAGYEEVRPEVDLIMDRFFMKRIGLRFLLRHHIESAVSKPGTSGIIHSNVAVGAVLRAAAKDAQELCRQRCGESPEVHIAGDSAGRASALPLGGYGSSLQGNLTHDRQFTYVPVHLQFSCAVLLQNACFAVAQRYASRPEPMPAVSAIFAHGQEEVSVKVSDQGGGIPRSELDLAWSYFDEPRGGASGPSRGRRHTVPLGTGNPLGAGLPLARLHARYYGGDLVLKCTEGFGTDAYLFLNRLGQNCENLPHGVRVSPAMSDSSVGQAACIRMDSLGIENELEAAFLQRKLREFRTRRAASTVQLNSYWAP